MEAGQRQRVRILAVALQTERRARSLGHRAGGFGRCAVSYLGSSVGHFSSRGSIPRSIAGTDPRRVGGLRLQTLADEKQCAHAEQRG